MQENVAIFFTCFNKVKFSSLIWNQALDINVPVASANMVNAVVVGSQRSSVGARNTLVDFRFLSAVSGA